MKKLSVFSAVAFVGAACGGTASNVIDPTPTHSPGAGPTSATGAAPTPVPTVHPDELVCHSGGFEFSWFLTDFSQCTIDIDEVFSGGVPRDGIAPLDAEGSVSIPGVRGALANFISVDEAKDFYAPNFPVAYVEIEGQIRGYGIHILTRHEVANDIIGDTPFVITFCPLCNTAIAYERTVDGRVLDFGVSGVLRNSDLVMWDRQTESWWQQATGEGIVGSFAGTLLKPIPMPVISFEEFANSFPGATVLSEDTGFGVASYGINPYPYYDQAGTRPFLFTGEIDPRLDALDRVVALDRDGEFFAAPFSVLQTERVANFTFADETLTILWAPGTASALDQSEIELGLDIGAAVPFSAVVDGQALTFSSPEPGVFLDAETLSTWTVAGIATEGPLAGKRLTAVAHTTSFWFAWAAFHPETLLWDAGGIG